MSNTICWYPERIVGIVVGIVVGIAQFKSRRYQQMTTSKLKDMTIKKAQPKEKGYKLSDGGGLNLLVKPNGTKCWRYSYRFAGKQKTLALGVYPEVSLAVARENHIKARYDLNANLDPGLVKRQERASQAVEQDSLFSSLAKEWWNRFFGRRSHIIHVLYRIEITIFPRRIGCSVFGVTRKSV